ncbi:MAG: enoyl-CoA hydratase/isomerase family protein [Acidobacteria bacterium]|nr:enoyl-CoA hydratase/isomerase family protein [Acidobacteriota bacterium]
MSYSEIIHEVRDGVAWITLNRPDRLNAWTRVMEEEFRAAAGAADADEAVRVIAVTGAGKGFCAGADMSLLSGVVESGGSTVLHRDYSWITRLAKPVIAAVNGHCVGLGFVIALYCDIRLAADTAKFSTIFAKRGLIAEYGLAWTLPRIVGAGRALDLLLTARTFDGTEAQRLGLVEHVFAEAEFAQRAAAYADAMARSVSPRSTRVMKSQVYAAMEETLAGATDHAYREMMASLQCEDFKEGVEHFLEKRPARFTGR